MLIPDTALQAECNVSWVERRRSGATVRSWADAWSGWLRSCSWAPCAPGATARPHCACAAWPASGLPPRRAPPASDAPSCSASRTGRWAWPVVQRLPAKASALDARGDLLSSLFNLRSSQTVFCQCHRRFPAYADHWGPPQVAWRLAGAPGGGGARGGLRHAAARLLPLLQAVVLGLLRRGDTGASTRSCSSTVPESVRQNTWAL